MHPIANDAAAIVANGSSGIEADNGSAILANEGDFAAMHHGLAIDLFQNALAVFQIDKDFGNLSLEQFFLGIVAEHAHESRVDLENGSFGCGDVDAFLERFEEFGEASFVLAERGDVAGEDGDAENFVVAHHGVGNAIEVENRGLIFQAELENAGPSATLHETGHGPLD